MSLPPIHQLNINRETTEPELSLKQKKQLESYHCTQTEPFIQIKYNSSQYSSPQYSPKYSQKQLHQQMEYFRR